MREIELNGTWHLENDAGQQYTAHVPGCIHTDLYSEDEMFRDWNSEHCRWIEQHDWIYTREFTLTPEDISEEAGIPELLLEGLDTYCEIRLNDVLVGTAENMFIPHRFCVKGRLRAGVNTLCVRFHSPLRAVADKPLRSGAFTTERLYTRRLQYSYSVRNWYRTGCPYLQKSDSALRWSIERAPDKTCGTVILYAEQYVHAVELEGFSGLSDNYFSMLPGEEKRVAFLDTAEMQSVRAYTLIPDRDEL